jgi:putative DNA-invertase from lambdoid prophage Rac
LQNNSPSHSWLDWTACELSSVFIDVDRVRTDHTVGLIKHWRISWTVRRLLQQVAIYARVSTSDQSCDRQLAELSAYAARCGFEVVASFAEVGTGAKNDRIERKKVIELARKKLIDLVLVSELSRWGRSTTDLRNTIEELAGKGVGLRALNGPDLDITSAQGKLMLNVLSAISEFERDLLGERIKSGVAHARCKGTKSGKAMDGPSFNQIERVKL